MDDLFFNDDHILIRDTVKKFADEKIMPIAREMDKTGEFPKKLVAEMSQLGFMGFHIPKKYGGAQLDMISYAMVIMELARADASVAITMAAHTSLGTLPLLILGNDDQKRKFLPDIASGKSLSAFGLTEPNSGSDAGAC